MTHDQDAPTLEAWLAQPCLVVVVQLLDALERDDLDLALQLMTPESRTRAKMRVDARRWRAILREKSFGISDQVEQGFGDPDIAYVRLYVTPKGYIGPAAALTDGMIATLVRRPSRGGWIVHDILSKHVLPADVPKDPG